MGQKGSKLSEDSVKSAELLLEKLAAIEGISAKKMFGGHGIFHDGQMFGMVDSKGNQLLKAKAQDVSFYESAGSTKHGKMPYYTIPGNVLDNHDLLLEWANRAINSSK